MDAARRATSMLISLRGGAAFALGVNPFLPMLSSHLLALRCCAGVFRDRGTGNGRCGMVHQVGQQVVYQRAVDRP